MPLDADTVRRLANIRYLHFLGTEQARLPEPQSAVAILMLHDAAEHLLVLAADHLGADHQTEFMKYWSAIKAGGVALPMSGRMKALNEARVALKHRGQQPHSSTIDKAVIDTRTFLTAATQAVFSIDYDSLSLADVVSQQETQRLLREAEAFNQADDRVNAMTKLADALEELLNPRPTPPYDRENPLSFGPHLTRLDGSDIRKALQQPTPARDFDDNEFYRGRVADEIAAMATTVRQLQVAMRMTAVGIQYAAGVRFEKLTPAIDDYLDGHREYHAPDGYAPTEDDYTFCYQFVVDVALRLAAAESQLVPPPWTDSGKRYQQPWVKIGERRL